MTLSIIIPSYNYGRYLPEAIESVLAQDYEDYELIIVDDGSTDNTADIIQEYASRNPCIKFFHHPKNLGLFAAANTGTAAAKGHFIHFFSADDHYLPGFLSNTMKLFQTHPDIGLVCSDLAYFDDGKTHFSREVRLLKNQEPVLFKKEHIVSHFLTTPFWVPGTTCIVKRELLEKHGPYDPHLENISDWFLCHKIALFEGIGYIPKIGVAMREHSAAYSSQVNKNKKRKLATYWYLLELLSKKENRELRTLFKKSAILSSIFGVLFWKVIFHPKYWDFFPYIFKKVPISQRIANSIKKKFINKFR